MDSALLRLAEVAALLHDEQGDREALLVEYKALLTLVRDRESLDVWDGDLSATPAHLPN
jgi:hypothetical protein